jgi:hypothetical protein
VSRETAILLRGFVLALVLLIVVWILGACATPAAATAPKPAFPPDMRLVCHEGAYHVASVTADQVVRLPLKCT